MKIFLILLFFLSTSIADQDNNDDNENTHCRWKYKCCKLFKGTCIEMCEPEIDCSIKTTTPKQFFGFAPAQALNVRCKFGYKVDTSQNCRRVLK